MSYLADKWGLIEQARLARRQSRKGILAQATEILALRLGRWNLSPSEYYDYRLFDDSLFSPAEKREFIGYRGQALVADALIDESFRGLCLDKLTFYSLMTMHGLPTPAIHAIYHPGGRPFPNCPTLTSPEALSGFLRNGMPYPFYGKSAHGIYGKTNVLIESYDSASDCLVRPDGGRIDVETFARLIPDVRRLGFLFQNVLRSHAEIRKICGERIAGVRFVAAVSPDEVIPFRALWKIVVGGKITDNFQHGRSGNMLGALDTETGEVKRVIRGKGPRQVEVELHPDSQARMVGFRIPHWERILEIVKRGAKALPGIPIQGWDIAVTDSGPILLEANLLGDMDLPQLACRKGYGDATFHALVSSLGMSDYLFDWSTTRLKKRLRARTLRQYSGHLLES